MKCAQFLARCQQSVPLNDRQSEDYLNYLAARFYRTYGLCCGLLPSGGSLLSVVAGSAYVEAVLASELQARVVAADFPAAIEINRRHYDANHFISVPADLSLDELELPIEPCDMVLSAEIVEHIPAAPSRHVRKLLPYSKPNGHFVVTLTPGSADPSRSSRLLRIGRAQVVGIAELARRAEDHNSPRRRPCTPSTTGARRNPQPCVGPLLRPFNDNEGIHGDASRTQ